METLFSPPSNPPVSTNAVIRGTLILLVALPILSLAYVYGAWLIPFVILKFLMLVIFGMLLGYVAKLAFPMLGVEKKLPQTILITCLFAISYYLQWALYLSLLANQLVNPAEVSDGFFSDFTNGFYTLSFTPQTIAHYLAHPGEMVDFIKILTQTGTFSFESLTPKGWVLVIFWVIEILAILFFALQSQLAQPATQSLRSEK